MAGNCDNERGFYQLKTASVGVTFPLWRWNLFNLEAFTCPTGHEVSNIAATGVPTYRYRYFGDWPNLQLYNGSGAYHGSDLQMIFGSAEEITGLPNTPLENQVQQYMMQSWAAFAQNPARGLESLGWPEYDQNGELGSSL